MIPKRRLTAYLCSFLLAIQLIPAAAFAQGSPSETAEQLHQHALVEKMLAEGDYVEGEAIAIVRVGDKPEGEGRVREG